LQHVEIENTLEMPVVEWQFVAATYLPRALDLQELLVFLEDYADFVGARLRVARHGFVPDTQLVTESVLPSGALVRMNLGH